MSYRLISANDISTQYPEVNDMPCIYADLPRGIDGGYYDMRESGELQAENAKLLEENNQLRDENDRLQTENDSLGRELQRMGNQYANVSGLNAVIHRQRKQLTEIQDAIARRNSENDKLRESAKAAWILFLKYGAFNPYELPEVDRVMESLNELWDKGELGRA